MPSPETRLSLVDFFVQNTGARAQLYGEHLAGIPDLLRLGKRLANKSATLLECCKVFQAVHSLRQLIKCLQALPDEAARRVYLHRFREMSAQFESYVELIENGIDLDSLADGDPIISHKFNDELGRLHRGLAGARAKAIRILNATAQKIDAEPDKVLKLESSYEIGFQLRISLKFEHRIRGLAGFTLDAAKKDGIRFTNAELSRCSEEYMDIRKEYERMQKDVLEEMLDALGSLFFFLETKLIKSDADFI